MYNFPNNNGPFGSRRGGFGSSNYQYQTLPYGNEQTQTSGLISKVMGLMAGAFLFAFVGAIIGTFVIGSSLGGYFIVAIAGLVVLIILRFAIQKPGLNLFLLYLFTFIEGMAISPIIGYYLSAGASNILAEAFFITAITTLALSAYAWLTKRDFSRLRDYLFFGLILLLVTSILGIFLGGIFQTPIFQLIIAFFGVLLFSGYMLFYVQRAKYMADTLPNAIGLTVSLFITILNLFLFILEILSIFQGGGRRR
jgi:FtsH-binding integral membrane protein